MAQQKSYEDLIVWQKAMDVVVEVYRHTDTFPKTEVYGLTSQMRRAAVSIPSNIAEGSRRRGVKESRQFLLIAYGSGSELETQLKIAMRLKFGSTVEFAPTAALLDEVMRMLNAMINK